MATADQVKRVRADLCEAGAITLTDAHDPSIALVIDYIEETLSGSTAHGESQTSGWELALDAIQQIPRPTWVRALIGSDLIGPVPPSGES